MVQTAILAPRVVGVAIWKRVRAAMTVARWRSAWPASAAISRGEAGVEEVEDAAEAQHEGGVDHVLAGGAPVQPGAVSRRARARKAATSAATGTPAEAMPGASAAGSIATSPAARSIARPLGRGDDAELALDAGERALDAEHGGDLGLGGEEGRDLGVAVEARR